MITFQKYVKVQSLDEAYELNKTRKNRIIGGMMWLRTGRGSVNTAIDISGLGLDTIEEDDEEFKIGAMVSLRKIEKHEGLNSYSNNAVQSAVKDIVGVQFRNMATVGGSIWGRFGFSDVLTVFLAMDTYVELHNAGIVPLSEFVNMKRDDDILVRIIVKKTPIKISYSAVRAQRTDFPVLACAVSEFDGMYKTTIGARPGKAILIKDEDGIMAAGITSDSAKAYADYVASHTPTDSNLRGSAEYRTHLTKVLTERNLLRIGGIE
ncbi:MAG: FAD binding domain-containing protein [Clostridia bacterium]|nr:FAD binding domain-containing protein [Clostridia bacterium]